MVIGVMPAFADTAMASRVTMPKLPPKAVAEAILAALRDEGEDVYPGEAAAVAAPLEKGGKAAPVRVAEAGHPVHAHRPDVVRSIGG